MSYSICGNKESESSLTENWFPSAANKRRWILIIWIINLFLMSYQIPLCSFKLCSVFYNFKDPNGEHNIGTVGTDLKILSFDS